jgi:hypothetical protein
VAGAPLESSQDAAYFSAWINRLISAAESSSAWNNESEKQTVLALYAKAKQIYDNIASHDPR